MIDADMSDEMLPENNSALLSVKVVRPEPPRATHGIGQPELVIERLRRGIRHALAEYGTVSARRELERALEDTL